MSPYTLSLDRFDGCAEFDERLLESAFAPTIDAAVDTHLARCGRCRRARDMYLTTADALSAALPSGVADLRDADVRNAEHRDATHRNADHRNVSKRDASQRDALSHQSRSSARYPHAAVDPRESKPAPASKNRWSVLLYALAAASVLVAAAWLAHLNNVRRADLAIVSTSGDARIELKEPRHAVLHQGTAEFEIEGEEASVDTPLGRVRAKDAKFRISTSLRKESEMNRSEAALLVTVVVTSGVVFWSSKDEHDIPIGAGETLVRPETSVSPIRSSAAEIEPTQTSAFGTTRVPEPVSSAPSLVSIRLIGRVLDDDTSLPLGDSDIHLRVLSDAAHLLEAHGTSTADGTFALPFAEVDVAAAARAISDLKPGTPYLIVSHPGYAPVHDASPTLKSLFVRWKPGTPMDLGDVRLKHGTRVSGRVLDENDHPVADAVLLLCELSNQGSSHPASSGREIGRTDASGRMAIGELLPASTRDENFLLVALTPLGMGWTTLVIVPGRGTVDDVEVHMASQALLNVSIVDEHDRPLAGARVRAVPGFPPHGDSVWEGVDPSWPGTNVNLAALFARTSDDAGRARFEHLALGAENCGGYSVVADCEGFTTGVFQNVYFAHARTSADCKLMLQHKRAWSISGRVLDETSRPVEGAIVRATSGWQGTKYVPVNAAETSTDKDGVFRLIDLDPDLVRVSLSAQLEGYPDAPRSVARPTIADVDGVDIVLALAASIEGRVIDDSDQPVPGARIGINQGSRASSQVTDSDGRFSFADATTGEWHVVVIPPEPRAEWRWPGDTELRGGTHAALIKLQRMKGPFARVTVEVIDADTGELLDPAAAMLLPLVRTTRTLRKIEAVRSRGRVVLDRVESGEWSLWVAVMGKGVGCCDIAVLDGQREILAQLKVGRPGTIVGRIQAEEMTAGETLSLSGVLKVPSSHPGGPEWEQDAFTYRSGSVSVTGEFSLDRLVPGRWSVRLSGSTLQAEIEVDVFSGTETRTDVLSEANSTLVFRATAGLKGTRLALTLQRIDSSSDPLKCFASLGDGSYTNRIRAKPGAYRWQARFVRDDGSAAEVAEPQSGEVSVSAATTANIVVPFVVK